jgi:plastocyanin
MKSSSKNFVWAAAATVMGLAIPLCGLGATANVKVVNFSFIPATTNINVGDQVTWTWPTGSGFHNVTSDSVPAAWPASPSQSGPATFSQTFTSGGAYAYECTIHGFYGEIDVHAPNLPPSVSITNPAANTVFSEPASVTVQASAADSDGTVTNVQFLVGAIVLTNKAAAPFAAITGNLAAGSYTLSAVASDNAGAKATNAVAISVVTPALLALGVPTQLSATSFQFNYSANIGLSYVIQQSTDLNANWTAIFTNVATSNPMTFVDTNAIASPGFYRVFRLPNP